MAFLDELIYLVKVNYSGGSFNKMDRDVRRVNKSMSVLKLNLGGVFAGLGAGFGGYQILTGLTDAAKKLDIIKTQFYVITESQEISNQLMKDSSRQAKEYGLDLYTVREGMSGWLGATKGTVIKLEEGRQMYEKLAASIGGMRMTKEEASGALLALGQMISKGKVQAEELRRQLANSLKGAYPIVANALFPGMTPSEAGRALDDALRAGKIDISYMGKIVNAIYGRFGKYAKDNANSVVANFNRMGNAWIALKERLVTSGFNDVLNRFATSMENMMGNERFLRFLDNVGGLSKALIPIVETLSLLLIPFLTLKGGGMIIKVLKSGWVIGLQIVAKVTKLKLLFTELFALWKHGFSILSLIRFLIGGSFMALLPSLAIVTAIVAVVILIATNWERITEFGEVLFNLLTGQIDQHTKINAKYRTSVTWAKTLYEWIMKCVDAWERMLGNQGGASDQLKASDAVAYREGRRSGLIPTDTIIPIKRGTLSSEQAAKYQSIVNLHIETQNAIIADQAQKNAKDLADRNLPGKKIKAKTG